MTDVQRWTFSLLLYGMAADDVSFMERFWQTEPEWLVLWTAVLMILVAIAWYVIAQIRPKPAQKERMASQWLSKCRESHSRGELTDEEFRTIKTTLAPRLQDELNGSGKNG
jgi:uncharacterized membrane protein